MHRHAAMGRSGGFTLIELMIVVTIVAILAGVAYPSYQRWVVETRRSDAHIGLSQLANELEKFYSECSEYTNRIATDPYQSRSCTLPDASGTYRRGTLGRRTTLSPSEHYELRIELSNGDTEYRLVAQPRLAQTADTVCTSLSLTNTGLKAATGSNPARCWRK